MGSSTKSARTCDILAVGSIKSGSKLEKQRKESTRGFPLQKEPPLLLENWIWSGSILRLIIFVPDVGIPSDKYFRRSCAMIDRFSNPVPEQFQNNVHVPAQNVFFHHQRTEFNWIIHKNLSCFSSFFPFDWAVHLQVTCTRAHGLTGSRVLILVSFYRAGVRSNWNQHGWNKNLSFPAFLYNSGCAALFSAAFTGFVVGDNSGSDLWFLLLWLVLNVFYTIPVSRKFDLDIRYVNFSFGYFSSLVIAEFQNFP